MEVAMEALSRSDYPAMLANLQPNQAVKTLDDRVKRITKINNEFAEWMVERRRVEEQYVNALRRLTAFKVPNANSELGVFQAPWDRILQSTHNTAQAHHHFAQRVEQDVENPLRAFHNRKEMQSVTNIAGNLSTVARELEEAQKKSDKLSHKGTKASTHKVEEAAAKLESATQQWEAQAPFVFESLQALDETRCNQLRDLLTQYVTHESDHAQRIQRDAEETLNILLETNTEKEIQDFAHNTVAGKPKLERRAPSARPSIGGASSTLAAPTINEEDHQSESGRQEPPHAESKLRRLGTMLGRRRQSIHGGFGQLSPQRGQRLGSSHGRVSPRASSNNLTETHNRLSALAESPTSPTSPLPPTTAGSLGPSLVEATNGVASHESSTDLTPMRTMSSVVAPNGVAVPEHPVPAQAQSAEKGEPQTDADGFTVRPAANDPISQAEKMAAEENGDTDQQMFKVNIQKEPIAEEDPDAKLAALSNVAHTLTAMGKPNRKSGTIRGRRDVRSTIYIADQELTAENPFPPSPASPAPSAQQTPPLPQQSVKAPSTAAAALRTESSIAATSDTQSVRSGNSLASLAHFQHPEMMGPGLNASIIESVSACFEGGAAKTVKLTGEIAFSYNQAPGLDMTTPEKVRINEASRLEAIGPNRMFVNPTVQGDGVYQIDVSHLQKTTTAFNYKVDGKDAERIAKHLPLLVKTDWRPQGDRLGLLLQYGLNPECCLDGPVTLSNVAFVASYAGRASGAQLKPAGTHLKDRHVIYWRLGDVKLTAGTWEKIVCRVVGAEGTEIKPGHVDAKWEHAPHEGSDLGSGISVSRLEEGKGKEKAKEVTGAEESDPFADDEPATPHLPVPAVWTNVYCKVKTVSGKYEAR